MVLYVFKVKLWKSEVIRCVMNIALHITAKILDVFSISIIFPGI